MLCTNCPIHYNTSMEHTKPHLQNIQAFYDALEHYRVSDHAQRILDETKLVIMSGLAGGGRNTVIKRLVDQYDYYFLVSDTTRPPKLRDGVMEQHGVQYYFRPEGDILEDIQKGEFVEAEVIHNQQVSGTSIREIERAHDSGKIAIAEVEFGGANNIVRAKPDTVAIALLPPDYDEWIKRLRGREVIHEGEFLNRMHTAEKVLENMLEKPYFKFVINDNLDHCVSNVRRVVEDGIYSADDHAAGQRITQAILAHVKAVLAEHQSTTENK